MSISEEEVFMGIWRKIQPMYCLRMYGYGQGMMIQSALLLDQMDDAWFTEIQYFKRNYIINTRCLTYKGSQTREAYSISPFLSFIIRILDCLFVQKTLFSTKTIILLISINTR
jgi:hypothetical protein